MNAAPRSSIGRASSFIVAAVALAALQTGCAVDANGSALGDPAVSPGATTESLGVVGAIVGAVIAPPSTCNALTQCCLGGGATFAELDAVAGGKCGAKLEALGCGGDASALGAVTTSTELAPVAIDSTHEHWWFEVVCPLGTPLPAECEAAPYSAPLKGDPLGCAKLHALDAVFLIDPNCAGGACHVSVKD